MVSTTTIDTTATRMDLIMIGFMVAGSIFAAMIGFMVMNMAYGITYPEMLVKYADNPDPDFQLYHNNTGYWSGEIDYYGEKLNQSMEPLCCHDFGEGKEWGDKRK